MSLASAEARLGASSASPIERRNWKTPIIFGVLTLLALLLFVVQGSPDAARFALSTRGDALQFDPVPVSGIVAGIVTTLVLLSVTVFTAVLVQRRQRVPFWAVVAGSVFGLFGFLAWAATGQTLQVPGFRAGAVNRARSAATVVPSTGSRKRGARSANGFKTKSRSARRGCGSRRAPWFTTRRP